MCIVSGFIFNYKLMHKKFYLDTKKINMNGLRKIVLYEFMVII